MPHPLFQSGLSQELKWLQEVVKQRVEELENFYAAQLTAGPTNPIASFQGLPSLPTPPASTPYHRFLLERKLTAAERVLLLLAIARAIQPAVLHPLFDRATHSFLQAEFGGAGTNGRFLPTLKTWLFLVAGLDLDQQQALLLQVPPTHGFFVENILATASAKRRGGEEEYTEEDSNDDWTNQQIRLTQPYLRYFSGGAPPRLDEEPNFPATLSETSLSFEDVVLPPNVREALEDLIRYVEHYEQLFELAGVKGRIKESYVVVFSGTPGTGKTLTANLLGKKLKVPVYVVNLSRIVSKYIGETEKNLEKVFNRFSGQRCILFFDEADALFGRRTEVKEAKDRYANQEVAYLLQKIETFRGLVILATNVHDVESTFDRAFQRRIRRHIPFHFPESEEREILWAKALPAAFQYQEGLLEKLAKNYQLNGASIHNILSDALVDAVAQHTRILTPDLLEPAMKIDYARRKMMFEVFTDEQVAKNPGKRYGNIYRGNF